MYCPYCKNNNVAICYDKYSTNIQSAYPAEISPFIKKEKLEFSYCKDCSLMFNSNKLSDKDYDFIYDNYIYISPFSWSWYSKFNKSLDFILKYANKNDSIIEIWCSEWYLLYILKNMWYSNIKWIEPWPQADIWISKWLNIIKSYFDDKLLLNEKINIFIMIMTFEHFNDPFSVLDNILKNISENWKIIIEVPNILSLGSYLHQHTFLYTTIFFKKLAKDNWLKLIDLLNNNWVLIVVMSFIWNSEYAEMPIVETKEYLEHESWNIYNYISEKEKNINLLLNNNKNKKIAFWGAGTSLVNLIDLVDPNLLDSLDITIVDWDINKAWLLVWKLKNNKVEYFEILKTKEIEYLVICSEFFEEIKKTITLNNIHINEISVFTY